jgi:hypothetical protein
VTPFLARPRASDCGPGCRADLAMVPALRDPPARPGGAASGAGAAVRGGMRGAGAPVARWLAASGFPPAGAARGQATGQPAGSAGDARPRRAARHDAVPAQAAGRCRKVLSLRFRSSTRGGGGSAPCGSSAVPVGRPVPAVALAQTAPARAGWRGCGLIK